MMMLKKITKNQVFYEINWIEVYENAIAPFLKDRYGLEFDLKKEKIRVRVTSKTNAMIKPDFIQFKLPETLIEERNSYE
jgi:hypothetical protein